MVLILHVNVKKKLHGFMFENNFNVDNNIMVLFEPSGSEKTTILRSIVGLLKSDDGEIIHQDQLFFCSGINAFMPA